MKSLSFFTLTNKRILILLALLAILLILRRPDVLLSAQFWAEDGAIWYANAHNHGALRAIFMTQDGYFSTYLRLLAVFSLIFPMRYAPIIFSTIALTLQLLIAALFLSSRYRSVASDATRVVIAFLFILLPNTAEIHGNATNAQWYLAILACAILLAKPAQRLIWKLFDLIILTLSSVSGPYTLFLLPIAGLLLFKERTRWRAIHVGILAFTSALQLWALFILNEGYRTNSPPVFDPIIILRIINRQIILGGTLGITWVNELAKIIPWHTTALLFTLPPAIILIGYTIKKGTFALRGFLFFAVINFIASLSAPNLGNTMNTSVEFRNMALRTLFASSSGARYWLIPIIAWMLVLIWSLHKKRPLAIRLLSLFFISAIPFGLIGDFRIRPLVPMNYERHLVHYNYAPKGTIVTIPINPPGWEMRLIKK